MHLNVSYKETSRTKIKPTVLPFSFSLKTLQSYFLLIKFLSCPSSIFSQLIHNATEMEPQKCAKVPHYDDIYFTVKFQSESYDTSHF